MKIKVKITDALTGEVIRDNEVETPEYSHEQMSEFHKKFERKYPNAHINFSWFPKRAKQSCFIYGMPLNMKLDEKKLDKKQITWEQYEKKWYSGSTMKQTA
jgi:hypothetical protein